MLIETMPEIEYEVLLQIKVQMLYFDLLEASLSTEKAQNWAQILFQISGITTAKYLEVVINAQMPTVTEI